MNQGLNSLKKQSDISGKHGLYTPSFEGSLEPKGKKGKLNGKLISTASRHPPLCAVWNLHPLHSTTLNSNSWFQKKIHFKKHAYLMKPIWCKHRDCAKFRDLNDGEGIKSCIPNLSTVWHVYTGMGTLYCHAHVNQYRKFSPRMKACHAQFFIIWYFQSHPSCVVFPTIWHHSFCAILARIFC